MAPDQVDLARAALRRGYTVTAAAAKAGVARETLQRWLKEDHTLCDARGHGRARLERAVLRDAMKDGRLALEVLSRRCRAWQKKDNVKLGGSVQVAWPNVQEGQGDGF